jgi:hypothetical protein
MKKLVSNIVLRVVHKASNIVMHQRMISASDRARKLLPAVLPMSDKYLENQRSNGGLSHFFSAFKLIELHQLLLVSQPKNIVELGGGSTTSVFASYLAQNPDAKLVTVDENDSYLNQTKEAIDSIGLGTDRIRYCHCPRIQASESTCRYTPNYLSENIDFLYVDGPTCIASEACADVTFICDSGVMPKVIAFDYRLASVRHFMESKHSARYASSLNYQTYMDEKKSCTLDEIRHHSHFRLL